MSKARDLADLDLTSLGGSTTYDDVGTYVFGYTFGTGGILNGSTYAGSTIEPAGVHSSSSLSDDNSTSSIFVTKGDSPLSGTWRAMGRSNISPAGNRQRTTLFVRIS